jgi:O-succinylbenzoic acid--CoA ligase
MASSAKFLETDSSENIILLNPRWPQADAELLTSLSVQAQDDLNLKGHVWIATSGSTADSASATKLVALSRKAIVASAKSVNSFLQSTSEDRWTQVLPSFHVGGMGIEVRAALSGATVVPALNENRWDVDHYFSILCAEACTLSALVPTQVYDLVVGNYEAPSALRAIVVGGGALDPALYLKARDLGWPLLPSYGMTETASQIATAPLKSLAQNEFPDIELLSHAQARRNDQGFLEVSAESLFTCYAQIQKDGPRWWDPKQGNWFTTEDHGDVQGRVLTIEGRSKDYIKIGGEGTNMARLRMILDECTREAFPQGAQKITLLEVPSARLGHEVHLVSSLSNDQTEILAQRYAEKVLPFEKAREIHYVTEIPRSDLGKILWQPLKKACKLIK